MNFVIFGSGFGLYGYLPAIYKISNKIFLNRDYKNVYNKRKELKKYSDKIRWYNNLSNIIDLIDYVVVTKRPQDQLNLIKKINLKKKKIKHFFLEKPIDINPKKSIILINYLKKNKINYSFGFIFKYLNWYKHLTNKKNTKQNFTLIWHLKKKTNNNKWKIQFNSGGGLIRFYGIHLIKILFDLKYLYIKKNYFNKSFWRANFRDKKNNNFFIELKYTKRNKFILKKNKSIISSSNNPFLKRILKNLEDPRVKWLKKYIHDILNNYKKTYKNDIKFIDLWHDIENDKTKFS